ncbi:MAG: hypothetical protein ACTSQK_01485 [Candidatus Heimdallarchaeota archaeon]
MVEENSLFNEDDYVDDPNKLTEKDIPKLIWMFEKRLQNLNVHFNNNNHKMRTILIILVIVLAIQTIIFGLYLSL